MDFNHRAGSKISHATAKKMVSDHKAKNPDHLRSVYFGREHFEEMLKTEGCVGIRVYYGLNEQGHTHPILVPTNSAGHIIHTDAVGASTIVEQGIPCPPNCNEEDKNDLAK